MGSGEATQLEALARLHPGFRDDRLAPLFRYAERLGRGGARLGKPSSTRSIKPQVEAPIGCRRARRRPRRCRRMRSAISSSNSCGVRRQPWRGCVSRAASSATRASARARSSGLFEHVFVPVVPAPALQLAPPCTRTPRRRARDAIPRARPSAEEIKATLDNCKLTYDWVGEHGALRRAVETLRRGGLVGWFTGSMEWGPERLGRDRFSRIRFPYVLENLNRFLTSAAVARLRPQRARGRRRNLFDGPAEAPFMECDYMPDRERFRHVSRGEDAAIPVEQSGRRAAA